MNGETYIFKVWHRAPKNWGWAVRTTAIFSSHVASGTATSRPKARLAASAAARVHHAEEAAKWQPVDMESPPVD